MGTAYGTSKAKAGKKLIIEHTSSNPNGPLHIGNLRNAILGAHLAELMKVCTMLSIGTHVLITPYSLLLTLFASLSLSLSLSLSARLLVFWLQHF
jgi:hypothetical protein